jgi:hypothetical protein
MAKKNITFSEVAHRRDAAIKRALEMPAKPMSDYIGTGERAKKMKENRVKKTRRAKP